MKKIWITTATILVAMLFMVNLAHACSLEGVWKGKWRTSSYGGSVTLTVDTKWGVRYVALQSSTQSGQKLPAEYYLRNNAASTVEFDSNAGRYSLRQNNCRLSGNQNHRSGKVAINLQKVGNNPRQGLPQMMSSQAALGYIAGKTFRGNWQWGQMSGSSTVSFAKTGQCVTAKVTLVYTKTERRRAVCVSTSRSWLTFPYQVSGKNGTALVTVDSSGRNVYMITHNGDDVLFRTLRRQ
jgi:hypothetical protein